MQFMSFIGFLASIFVVQCIHFCIFYLGKAWKRMVTKVTYVGDTFTRKPVKFERFIRPMVSTIDLMVDKYYI